MPIIYVTGGARSGKSSYAERLAARAETVTYLATAQALDDEMRARIGRHRRERPAHWRTVEEPLDLCRAVTGMRGALLLDCLSLWVSNVMLSGADDADTLQRAEELRARDPPRGEHCGKQ